MSTTDQGDLATIVLAAGLGTRMRSSRAKVLHELGGEPIIVRLLRTLVGGGFAAPIVVVLGHQAELVQTIVSAALPGAPISFAIQPEQHGTGHAAQTGFAALPRNFSGGVRILYGDMPLITPHTLRQFVRAIDGEGADLGFISLDLEDAGGYGRVVRDSSGAVERIVELRDARGAEVAIREANMGYYYAPRSAALRAWLAELTPENAQHEYYLTDVIGVARRHGGKVAAWKASAPAEFAGINSREELAAMESQLREQLNRRLMQEGVTLIDPATAYISEQTEIGRDCVIGPNVQIVGRSKIGAGVVIEGTAWLKNVEIGARCHLKIGVRAEDCRVGADSELGPFCNLRAGTELEGHNRVGNFVETKNAKLGRGTKASHLSYLGDATIGRGTNIGCGVITVNYDGYEKHQTHIGDRCMVGCDSQLIAPVTVGSDVYVASGTTIIREVPDGALVLSHHPQREKSGWMAEFHKRHAGRKPWFADTD
ncbi:MAG TPA: bifunctional UDP-N-acetylglucosamine diphosphorylase/glucosamine-1-phosphate N-acetyltransferase GlmU [Candidatus Binataceae bacterium]|nr:bifunctional UDP-N-acetylglucosamine diphosphorylase/glucosamine-1-phosphate N-acetyltransferase GlmU [Candidatus Binataceae bacterium]